VAPGGVPCADASVAMNPVIEQIAQVATPAKPGYVTINAEVEIEPGIESGYLLDGGIDLPIQGQPTRSLKPGDGFTVPPETPHAGVKNGDKTTKLAITYIVEKGKPLASPA
jgi:hypothetical protein